MKAAGINTDIFKPHSTRAASTSKAQSCDVPISSILKAASWKRGSVFHRFYNGDIVGGSEHTEFVPPCIFVCTSLGLLMWPQSLKYDQPCACVVSRVISAM